MEVGSGRARTLRWAAATAPLLTTYRLAQGLSIARHGETLRRVGVGRVRCIVDRQAAPQVEHAHLSRAHVGVDLRGELQHRTRSLDEQIQRAALRSHVHVHAREPRVASVRRKQLRPGFLQGHAELGGGGHRARRRDAALAQLWVDARADGAARARPQAALAAAAVDLVRARARLRARLRATAEARVGFGFGLAAAVDLGEYEVDALELV